jgi:hypothetical protein
MARARFLTTWFNANGKRCKSHLPLPDFKRPDSYNDSFVLNNPQGSKRFLSRFPKPGNHVFYFKVPEMPLKAPTAGAVL